MNNLYIVAVMLWNLDPRGWTGDREKADVDYVVADSVEMAGTKVAARMEALHNGYGVRQMVIKQVDVNLLIDGPDGTYRIRVEQE